MEYPESESSTLEFKEKPPKNDQILKTVVAFCNLYGGRIIIGVKDSGQILGIAEGEIDSLLEYLDKSIYESCSPPIIPEIHSQRYGEKLVLIIQVSAGMQKPYFLRSEGLTKGTYIRLGKSTVRADEGTLQDLHRQNRRISFDTTPFYNSRVEEVEKELFARFLTLKGAGSKGGRKDDLLKSYHLLVEEQSRLFPTVGGLLLFNANPQKWFPEAFIICSTFSGISGRTVLATKDMAGDLFSQFEGAFDFVASSLKKSFVIKGKKREEKFEIPMIAVREALLNAIVHRNYALPAPIKVAIYEDRIEIFSPGIFPGPFDVNNLTAGITYIRNAAITKIFREAGYIEKLGSGFITMVESYQAMGLQPPVVVEGENFVKCILSRLKDSEAGDLKDEPILRLFFQKSEISIRDVMENIGLPRATAGRLLLKLERSGAIRKKGKGSATRYLRPR
ncbi:MAG: putative DNA binding domain-containing protein [Fibrobacterota bacterium]|nr:putative DNA binding domain-containing protein [Fibrobacterota bacterium]